MAQEETTHRSNMYLGDEPPIMADGRPDETWHVRKRYRERIKNPITAIRCFCVECMGGYVKEVTHCTSVDCPLFPLRMGTNTMSARYGTKRSKKET